MGWLIVQYDDRPSAQFDALVERTREYAASWGITHVYLRAGYEHLPPWWRKVFLVQELLPLYDGVVWVDTDATIVGAQHVSKLLGGKHFVFSPNPPMLGSESLSMFSAPFCAGVWAVANTPEGRTIMSHWAGTYDKRLWSRTQDGRWSAVGRYGGPAYEQGAFEVHVLRTADFYDWLRPLPSHVLNYLPRADAALSGRACPAEVFAVHYWSGQRGHIHLHFPGVGEGDSEKRIAADEENAA